MKMAVFQIRLRSVAAEYHDIQPAWRNVIFFLLGLFEQPRYVIFFIILEPKYHN